MSFLSHISPVRSFPDYTGPYKVGTCDVELAVSELESPASCPDDSIGTVSFRIFYPCEAGSSNRPVRWIPSPQSKYGAAYCRFMGAGPWLSEFMAMFPQFLYMTKLPALRSAKILPPSTTSKRWPVMMFSHGLGGSRNAYSHICGSIASYGIIVVAPDHRDMSAPASFIRATKSTEAKTLGYKKMSHTPSAEVYRTRDHQLRIRLWEMGCIHDAIVRMDRGAAPENLDINRDSKDKPTDVLSMFKGIMDVHRPGSIIWAGHSFGAATTVQLLKSTYYNLPTKSEMGELGGTLFEPDRSSGLVQQITSSSVALLLDMWCLPLRSKMTRWLWDKPLPCYDTTNEASKPPGGKVLTTVLSEAFVKWTGNFNDTKIVLSPKSPSPSKHVQWTPYFFYPTFSAHLSQSDFGILFPWILARFLKTKEPERMLQLSARAMLQTLRVNGYEVAPPSISDLELETSKKAKDSQDALTNTTTQDLSILEFGSKVRDWHWVEIEAFKLKEGDDGSAMHVEQDYQTPAVELDEAEVLDFQTPGADKANAEFSSKYDSRSNGPNDIDNHNLDKQRSHGDNKPKVIPQSPDHISVH